MRKTTRKLTGMARNELLENRVREALAPFSNLEEKRMFGGMAFMVAEKLCVSVGTNHLLCRIDPELRETVLEMPGCREMIHNGRVMKGFVFVAEEAVKSKKAFDYWMALALESSKKATPAKKNKRSSS